MFSKFLGELLFLVLIILVCSRFLYIGRLQFDPLSVLAVLIWPTSLLLIFAYGFSTVSGIISIIAFFVMLWNLRSFIRFRQKLAFDHYSLWFIGTSILNILICVFLAVVLIINHPVPQKFRKNHIIKETVTYTGNFSDGFKKSYVPFRKRNAILTRYYYHKEEIEPVPQELIDKVKEQKIFKKKDDIKDSEKAEGSQVATVIRSSAETEEVPVEVTEEDTSRKIILFLPSKSALPGNYVPLFKELTKAGFTVYTAEFYTKDVRWFNSILDWRIFRSHALQYKKIFNVEKFPFDSKTEYYEKELTQLLNFISPVREDTIYMVGDQDCAEALQNVHNNNFALIDAWYDISAISAYSTPGFGFIEQEDPLLAKKFGLSRDESNIYAASVSTILLNELEFNGQLNSFTLQQRENKYGKDENNYEGFSADTTGTLEIEAPELELE
jgi:hypothetical protein